MDLTSALSSAPTPIARAALLTFAALRGDGDDTWTLCAADGSPTEQTDLTLISKPEDLYFRTDTGDIVRFKWVPMDDASAVLIAQRGSGGDRRTSLSLSVTEEPLLSALREAAADPHLAARTLRTALLRELRGACGGAPVQGPRAGDEPPPVDALRGAAPVAAPLFAGVAPRPPGFRYGDGDLLPGGALLPGGGMRLDARAFAAAGGCHARYDPIFPGDVGPRGGHRRGGAAIFRGEPDPDELRPLGGDPFGPGSAFGPGRMGGPGSMGGIGPGL